MTETVSSCPLCGSASATPFDQRQFRGQAVNNQICPDCGLVYQSPRMTVAERNAFYEDEYRLLYQGQAGPGSKDLATQQARAGLAISFIQPRVKNLKRILDIGCSTGALMQQFQAHYHAQVTGIEPGTAYRQYALGMGLDVHATLEELLNTNSPPFDLVSMMHVLEHLPDPVAYLRNLQKNLVAPGGWLLLEVPNLYAHDSFEVAHLVSFSTHTLTQAVESAGYNIIQLRRHGLPRSRVIPLYITLLAKSAESKQFTLKPDRLVRLKRQVGFFRRRLLTRLFPRQAWLPVDDHQPEKADIHAQDRH